MDFEVNGEIWKVCYVYPYNHHLQRDDGTFAYAACNDNTRTIYISNAISGSLLKRVMCHEVTHAVLFAYDIRLSRNLEELLADLVATYGMQIVGITRGLLL